LESDLPGVLIFNFFTGKTEKNKSAQQQDSRDFIRDIMIDNAEIFRFKEGVIECEYLDIQPLRFEIVLESQQSDAKAGKGEYPSCDFRLLRKEKGFL
jgi:hypothetical protein